MSSRYENIPNKTNEFGKQVKRSIIYPTIPRSLGDIYVQTNVSDRLDLIAYRYYGNPSYYWILAEANGLGKGSMSIPVGTQLRIPQNFVDVIREYELLNK